MSRADVGLVCNSTMKSGLQVVTAWCNDDYCEARLTMNTQFVYYVLSSVIIMRCWFSCIIRFLIGLQSPSFHCFLLLSLLPKLIHFAIFGLNFFHSQVYLLWLRTVIENLRAWVNISRWRCLFNW